MKGLINMIKTNNNTAHPIFKNGMSYEDAIQLIESHLKSLYTQLTSKDRLTLDDIVSVHSKIYDYKNNNTEYNNLLSNLSTSCDYYADLGYDNEQYLYVKKIYSTIANLPINYLDKIVK